ncbi:thioredoxin domain-containing protein [Candidatus Pyrohabitans sp.]
MRPAVLLGVVLLFLGCISAPQVGNGGTAEGSAKVAEDGDYVEAEYTLYSGDRILVEGAGLEAILGKGETLAGVEEAIIGMKEGESREIELPPEKAFGLRNTSLIYWEPRLLVLPRVVNISIEEFKASFGLSPEKGTASERKWFRVRVRDVGQGYVLVEREPLYTRVNVTGGIIQITENVTHITYFFTPEINQTVIDTRGRFVTYRSANATHVLVDRNHPLAGEVLHAKVRLLRLIKGAELEKIHISWYEDVGSAIREAVATDKPVILYFYSRDCEACTAMDETFQDARLRMLNDELVFARVDLSAEAALAARYGIAEAPAVIILNSRGERLARLEGELSAQEIEQTLRELEIIP